MESDQIPGSDNTVTSSPLQSEIFSDDAKHISSPPSSPSYFPWERQDKPNTTTKVHRKPASNAFSMLGKRKALAPASENVQSAKKQRTTAPAKSTVLTQMQISLGQEVQKRCKTCGMEYVASSTEDRRLHDKYHKQNTLGYDVGKDFVQKARPFTTYPGTLDGDWICAVDCYDNPARRRRAQAALAVVQRELGAVEIPEDDLWGNPSVDPGLIRGPKYVAYMYIRRTKCIAYLLVQKISEAFRVEEPVLLAEVLAESDVAGAEKPNDSKPTSSLAALRARKQAIADKVMKSLHLPLALSAKPHSARLGISRIWTSPLHRKHSLATTLLDTAITYHDDIVRRERDGEQRGQNKAVALKGKEYVAFSQPTAAGRRLAERWFRRPWGWGVYVD